MLDQEDSTVGISACLVCRHEEPLLERCLRSLEGVVDEIVLVHDGPCEDRTLDIAERYGCRIVVADYVGAAQPLRPLGLELARGEWLLVLDADEFLSDELRAGIRSLAEQSDIAGWEFPWPVWDGERYVTDRAEYKLRLVRRSAARILGVPHALLQAAGPTRRTGLVLEHRPLYDNYTLQVVWTKWRPSARVHARVLCSDWSAVSKFGSGWGDGWPWWRVWTNRLSPVLFAPYALATFLVDLWRLRNVRPQRQRLRIAAYQALRAGLVQAYVAKCVYLDRPRAVAADTAAQDAAQA